jgi:hypothetical protein
MGWSRGEFLDMGRSPFNKVIQFIYTIILLFLQSVSGKDRTEKRIRRADQSSRRGIQKFSEIIWKSPKKFHKNREVTEGKVICFPAFRE